MYSLNQYISHACPGKTRLGLNSTEWRRRLGMRGAESLRVFLVDLQDGAGSLFTSSWLRGLIGATAAAVLSSAQRLVKFSRW